MAGSRTAATNRTNGKGASKAPTKAASTSARITSDPDMHGQDDETLTPLAVADALCRTAHETCRQHERRARLTQLGAGRSEVTAAHALVDTCDLALQECTAEFEKKCGKVPVTDEAELRQAASTLWFAAREYLKRVSIVERASRQISQQHDVEKFADLQIEYEFEASALLALKHATTAYFKLRPEAR